MTHLSKILSFCFRSRRNTKDDDSASLIRPNVEPYVNQQHLRKDENLWHASLFACAAGEVSSAAVSANEVIEDHSEVHSGETGTFLGVYDGHGGPQTSMFLKDRLYLHFQKTLSEDGGVASKESIRRTFQKAEQEFTALVRASWHAKPQLASVGSCALVGVVQGTRLYVACLGDSRAVLGTYRQANGVVAAVQLSREHNANLADVRQELHASHPYDKDIVVQRMGVWRVKGIIQVSRAIGDVYLKFQEFQTDPLVQKFRLPEPLTSPALSADPTIVERVLRESDRFVILASDGLWEHITNQEAVDMVHTYPRKGIAKRLVVAALMRAARKRGIQYSHLKLMPAGSRRQFHDDISVVVHFFDFAALSRDPGGSAQGGVGEACVKSGEDFHGGDLASADDADIELMDVK